MCELQECVEELRIEPIFDAYYVRVYRFVYKELQHHENAMDVTAEVFASIWRNLPRFDAERGKLSTWIYAVARNAVLNFRKRAAYGREFLEEVPDVPAPEEGTDDFPEAPEDERLGRILGTLSEAERALLVMRYCENLSNAEVGKVLGLSEAAVKQRYYRLLLKCRKMYGEAT